MNKVPLVRFLAAALIALLVLSAFPVQAGEAGAHILVLYKSRDPNHEGVVSYLTGFLKEGGFTWEARDVEEVLVKKEDLSRFSGILTCYLSSQMVGGHIYPRFLLDQMEGGRKICIVGSYGAYQGLIPRKGGGFIEWNESTQAINTFFWPFGLEFLFGWTSDPQRLEVRAKDSAMVEFQAPLLSEEVNYYQLYRSVNSSNNVYLSIRRKDVIESDSAFVVHTPFGGMILEGYGYFWDGSRMRQRVDMVRFIREALTGKPPAVPMYEVTRHRDLLATFPMPAREAPARNGAILPGELARKVLVVYKRSEAPTVEDIPIFNRAEPVLNHLGLILEYRAVEDGLPKDAEMATYRGILTWHTTSVMENADAYGKWLRANVSKGRKVVILQDYGAFIDKRTQLPSKEAERFFRTVGMKVEVLKPTRIPFLPDLKTDDLAKGFEHEADNRYITYGRAYRSTNPSNAVHMSMTEPYDYNGKIDLVLTGKWGGAAFEESPFYFPPGDLKRVGLVRGALKGKVQPELAEEQTIGEWIIDPYAFFSEAFDLEDMPAPDFTTLNGSRIFYSHIDGDGLESISLVDRAHMAGLFVYDELLRSYPDLPCSVSVISRPIEEVGNRYYNPALELARRIFILPNVEVATHTARHPFDWVGGDPYVVNPDSYPWKIGYRPQDLAEETWGSRLFIEKNLAPPDKKCGVLFWSGACNPDEKALEAVYRSGMRNLNGGDPIYDDDHALSGLAPLGTRFGAYRQIHTSAQNDYIYTLYMTGDWAGQKKVIGHFRKTGEPRRIYPMNLYYHFYSGIMRQSLDALKEVLDWCRTQKSANLYASEFCALADDWFTARVGCSDGAWWCDSEGAMLTLRFKKVVWPDLQKSSGIAGYMHFQGSTYVHLVGRGRHLIYLRAAEERWPRVEQCTFRILEAALPGNGVTITASGFGKGYFSFAGLTEGASYRLGISDASGASVAEETITAGADGRASYERSFPAPLASYRISLVRKEGR
jgi:hypothetical protein